MSPFDSSRRGSRCEKLDPAMAMMGWMLAARASLMANVPREEDAPYTMRGRGRAEARRGAHGVGRYWRRKREMAAVVVTSGIVAASRISS